VNFQWLRPSRSFSTVSYGFNKALHTLAWTAPANLVSAQALIELLAREKVVSAHNQIMQTVG
jgi:hypothetical protein